MWWWNKQNKKVFKKESWVWHLAQISCRIFLWQMQRQRRETVRWGLVLAPRYSWRVVLWLGWESCSLCSSMLLETPGGSSCLVWLADVWLPDGWIPLICYPVDLPFGDGLGLGVTWHSLSFYIQSWPTVEHKHSPKHRHQLIFALILYVTERYTWYVCVGMHMFVPVSYSWIV